MRNKIYIEHKDESIYLKILEYADIVLKYCIRLGKLPLYKAAQKRLTIQLELVDIYEGKDYITVKDKFYGFAKRYRNYETIVYLIKCKNSFPNSWFKKKKYFGYTHSTERIRFKTHIQEAIEQNIDYQRGYRRKIPANLTVLLIWHYKIQVIYLMKFMTFSKLRMYIPRVEC